MEGGDPVTVRVCTLHNTFHRPQSVSADWIPSSFSSTGDTPGLFSVFALKMRVTRPCSPGSHPGWTCPGLHPRPADLAQRGLWASLHREVRVPWWAEPAPPLPHLSDPLMAVLDLTRKALANMSAGVAWGGEGAHRSQGLSGKRERGDSRTRSPGGGHAGAQLEKGPGWKHGPLSFAATGAAGTAVAPSGKAGN